MLHADVEGLDVTRQGEAFMNLAPAELLAESVARAEGQLAAGGALAVYTAPYTGRSPRDKYIVREPTTQDDIWWGKVNVPLSESNFDGLYRKIRLHLGSSDRFIQDAFACADPEYRLRIRMVSERASAALFAHNMLIRPTAAELEEFRPEFTVLHAPSLRADPAEDGTRSEAFVAIHFGRGLVLIGGTGYAGEIKKSLFSVLNYLLPQQQVLSMHCSANIGAAGDTALYFGLSGTGKTTLSADPERQLIGDDEHGWSERGVFNCEGGCYAKLIRLSPTGEPDIYATTSMPGTLLENVVVDSETGALDLDSDAITENTRGSYPIHYIQNTAPDGMGGHPPNIFFLAADAFGVLPPISALTPTQAMYHFVSGYTAKVAGTERGVVEPQATFSACFGEPFLPLQPFTYARMLQERLRRHGSQVWLVNTGWTGGPYGVGERISLEHTRALLHAALEGSLSEVAMWVDPVFGLHVPEHCPGVPDELLHPRDTWPDCDAYDEQAQQLAAMFRENMAQYADQLAAEVIAAGPRLN